MKRLIFKEKTFEYSLITYIIILLFWNFYVLTSGALVAILPLILQGILLFLILSKNKNAKIVIKFWSIILILSHGISFLAKVLKISLGDNINLTELLNKTVFLIVGILIYVFNEKYVEISQE